MNTIDTDDLFDYWCPKCNNYILLERSKADHLYLLEGTCALCGEMIDILYDDWEEAEKKRLKKEDEEVNNNA